MKKIAVRLGIGLCLALSFVGSAPRVFAVALLRTGFGAAPGDLQAIIGVFQSDLGGEDHGNSGNLFLSGYRSINWDDIPDANAAPGSLAGNFYNSTLLRGAVISTPGDGLQVSATPASGVPVNFGNIDSSYGATFQAFSAERLFTPLGGIVTDFTFFVPGNPSQSAWVTGFGAVFSDVDSMGETSLEMFDLAGQSLFTGFAPSSPNGGLSFLGISFADGEQVGRVRITTGNTALGAGVLDGGAADLVVMDNVYFGEPTAVPEPGVTALLGMGALLFAGFQWRCRRSPKGGASASDS
jgi:hypothetical protein